MNIIRHLSEIPSAAHGGAVAIGNFDGLHLGHRHLLEQARSHARKNNTPFIVLSFEPHPRRFFQPDLPPFRLTPFAAKSKLLQDMSCDYFLCLNFDKDLAGLGAQDFVEKILIAALRASAVFIGQDFVFGKARAGSVATLKEYQAKNSFQLHTAVLEKDKSGEIISSSRIREFLQKGEPQSAAKLLGRNWTIEGIVQKGERRGSGIGFPTANLQLKDYLRPALGVYAARAHYGGKTYKAAVNIGIRPTVGGENILLEAHLLNFSGDLYGKHLAIELIAFLRGEQKFPSLDALKAQIGKDCDLVIKSIVDGP